MVNNIIHFAVFRCLALLSVAVCEEIEQEQANLLENNAALVDFNRQGRSDNDADW